MPWNVGSARIRARPLRFGALAAGAVAALVVVLVWFQPQALLFDTVVDEAFPTAEADDAAGADEPAGTPEPTPPPEPIPADPGASAPDAGVDDDPDEPPGPALLAGGSFESRNRYTVTGEATVYEHDDGSRTLRLEDFSSTNGPDLFVYLTAAGSADADAALDEDFVNLGVLKGNVGNQNYDIPEDVDLDRYDTVVIWCRRFTVSFGAADLAPSG